MLIKTIDPSNGHWNAKHKYFYLKKKKIDSRYPKDSKPNAVVYVASAKKCSNTAAIL